MRISQDLLVGAAVQRIVLTQSPQAGAAAIPRPAPLPSVIHTPGDRRPATGDRRPLPRDLDVVAPAHFVEVEAAVAVDW